LAHVFGPRFSTTSGSGLGSRSQAVGGGGGDHHAESAPVGGDVCDCLLDYGPPDCPTPDSLTALPTDRPITAEMEPMRTHVLALVSSLPILSAQQGRVRDDWRADHRRAHPFNLDVAAGKDQPIREVRADTKGA
jgi:hypothetical protein